MNTQPGRCESNGCIYVNADAEPDLLVIGSTETGESMRCTPAEFAAFIADVAAGRYGHFTEVAA